MSTLPGKSDYQTGDSLIGTCHGKRVDQELTHPLLYDEGTSVCSRRIIVSRIDPQTLVVHLGLSVILRRTCI